MKLEYSIKEEMAKIDEEYSLNKEQLETIAIECLYNRCFEKAKSMAKTDISKPFKLEIEVSNGLVLANIS